MFDLIDGQYIYIAITIPFFIACLLMFWFSKENRGELLFVGLAFAIIGPFVENLLYFKDYWLPESLYEVKLGTWIIQVEAFLFGASFAGFSAIIFQTLRGEFTELPKTNYKEVLKRSVYLFLVFLCCLPLIWMGLNSIYATSIAALLIVVFIILQRQDLIIFTLGSALTIVLLQFLFYSVMFIFIPNLETTFEKIWYLHNTPYDIRLGLIPLTELVWGALVGTSVSLYYKYIFEGRLKVKGLN